MEQQDLKQLTPENVWDLDEEQIFALVTMLENEPVAIVQRRKYYKIIDTAFDFRTISKTRHDKQKELAEYGFKFFRTGDSSPILTGIYKRKKYAVR